MKKYFTYRAIGTIEGLIWMPCELCTKDFDIKFSKGDEPFTQKFETLDDIKNHITNDGDFRGCEIIEGDLIITMHYDNRTITRIINLAKN